MRGRRQQDGLSAYPFVPKPLACAESSSSDEETPRETRRPVGRTRRSDLAAEGVEFRRGTLSRTANGTNYRWPMHKYYESHL